MGGKKRAQNMTPEQRRESSRRAALIRWALVKYGRRVDGPVRPRVSVKAP